MAICRRSGCQKRIPRNKSRNLLYCSRSCKNKAAYSRSKTSASKIPNSEKTIISLCDESGAWSKPYKDAGYNVIMVDIKTGDDLRLMEYQSNVYGLLMAPPCTKFSLARNGVIETEEEMLEALSVVDACLRFVVVCDPVFWAMENPSAKLTRYLGKPSYYFHPYYFGDPYTKRTSLWGRFNSPTPKGKCEPMKPASGYSSQDVYLRSLGHTFGSNDILATLRSKTPPGFSQAFCKANP